MYSPAFSRDIAEAPPARLVMLRRILARPSTYRKIFLALQIKH